MKKLFGIMMVLAMSVTLGLNSVAQTTSGTVDDENTVVITCSKECKGMSRCWAWSKEKTQCVRCGDTFNYCMC